MFQKLAFATALFLLPAIGFTTESKETKMTNVSILCQSNKHGFIALSSSENRLWYGKTPYKAGGLGYEARDVSLTKNGPALDVYGLFEFAIMGDTPDTTTIIGQIMPNSSTTFVSVDLFEGKVSHAEPFKMNCRAL